MICEGKPFLLGFILGLLLFLLLVEGTVPLDFNVGFFFLLVLLWLGGGRLLRVNNFGDFGDDSVEVGPIVGIFLREDEFSPEEDFEGSNMGEDYILIGVGINILILCDFEGDEVLGYHIADDFEVGLPAGHHVGN